MTAILHHASVFVVDVERSLHLYRDLLGFNVVWHHKTVGGRKLSVMIGIPDFECEMVYLEKSPGGVALELIRVRHPPVEKTGIRFGNRCAVGLSMQVNDLDLLHRRLSEEGWTPLSPCMELITPKGERMRAFCFSTDEGVTVELLAEMTDSRH